MQTGVNIKTLFGHKAFISSVKFSADCKKVISSS